MTKGASGKTEKQLTTMAFKDTSGFLTLMDQTHPEWGVKKAMDSQAIKTRYAKALDKNAHGWIDSDFIGEQVAAVMHEGPAKSGANKGKIKAIDNRWCKKADDVWTEPTKAAVKKAIKDNIAEARKWTVDRAKIKGLKFWDWSTWGAYWDYFYGGSTDIFNTAGIGGYEKNTLHDLKYDMIEADMTGRVGDRDTFLAFGMDPSNPKATSSSRSAEGDNMARKNPKRSTDVKKRKGPAVSANSVASGTRKRGNDGQMWTSKRMPAGYNRWVRGAESQVTWQDDSGFSSASSPPSDVFMADGDGIDLELSLENPIRDGAYVAIGLGLGTLGLGVGLSALAAVLSRLTE